MLRYKMPSFLITFRPHPNEPSILDTFLHLFFGSELFLTASEYKYNIEKDGTPDRHFHIFLTTSLLRDKEKVYNFLSRKEFLQFKKWLSKKDTEFTHGINVILVGARKDRNDRLYRIGYVSKDRPSPFGPLLSTDMSIELIQQGLNYMVEWDRIHITEKDYSKDIKQLTIKTVIPQIMYYHEEKDFPLDELIFDRLAKEGVFTPSLTDSQENRIISQLRIYYGIKDYHKPHEENSKITFKDFAEVIKKEDCGYTTIKGEKKCNKCLSTFPCNIHKSGD